MKINVKRYSSKKINKSFYTKVSITNQEGIVKYYSGNKLINETIFIK